MRTIATAGHVDHGKSSLVLALTGTDPDRFPEEKARGLTIDLGFAFTSLPSGAEVGFVDVPGHVRFIKNMLAGVGAVDVVLLVVAANEGWMPQSEEHLRIVELLGVREGLAVVTKADTVDGDTLELARLELTDHLEGSALAEAPVVVCDSVSGRGLDDVRAAIDEVLGAVPPPRDRGRPRLWVDRVFAARGAGTVVTGTLTGGSFAVDDETSVGPQALRGRIRGIQTAHRGVERAEPGARVALNIAGVEHREVQRGDAVVAPRQWLPVAVADVALTILPELTLPRRARVHCHIGSGEHDATLRVLDPDRRFARLRISGVVPLAPGDRIVLRDPGRRTTVAGAEVLDVAPAGRPRDAPDRLSRPLGERLVAARPWLRADDLGPLAGLADADAAAFATDLAASGVAVRVGDRLVAPEALARLRARVYDAAREHHRSHPLDPGVELATLATGLGVETATLRAALHGANELVVEHGLVRHASQRARVSESPEARRLVAALAVEPFAPPDPAAADGNTRLVRALVREGTLVDLEGVVFAAAALDDARARVRAALRDRGSVTVADVRDLLGSTRKFVLPILKRLDAEGVTRRRGDHRLPGPAAFPGGPG